MGSNPIFTTISSLGMIRASRLGIQKLTHHNGVFQIGFPNGTNGSFLLHLSISKKLYRSFHLDDDTNQKIGDPSREVLQQLVGSNERVTSIAVIRNRTKQRLFQVFSDFSISIWGYGMSGRSRLLCKQEYNARVRIPLAPPISRIIQFFPTFERTRRISKEICN